MIVKKSQVFVKQNKCLTENVEYMVVLANVADTSTRLRNVTIASRQLPTN
jgi:hypothetical protein